MAIDGVVSLLLGAVGIVFFLTKRTVFSIAIGMQWAGLGILTALVTTGQKSGRIEEVAPFAFLGIMVFVAMGVLSLSLMVRLLYLRRRVSIVETRGMHH